MRKLKFRAWDTSYNKMIKRYMMKDFRLAINSDGKVIGYEEETEENECLEYHDRFIVMQCPGLKDKNGNDMYDGDIIKYDFRSTGYPDREIIIKRTSKIKWNEHTASWMVVNDFLYDGYLFEHAKEKSNIEIIGNIYEPPI